MRFNRYNWPIILIAAIWIGMLVAAVVIMLPSSAP